MNLAATVNVVLYDRMAKGINTRSGPQFGREKIDPASDR